MSEKQKSIRTALLWNEIPTYRERFLYYISKIEDIEVVCFHSQKQYGGAKLISVGTEYVKKIRYTKQRRLLYQAAFWKIVLGGYDVVVCVQIIHNITTLLLWLLHFVLPYKFCWWGIGFDPYRQPSPDEMPSGIINRLVIRLKNFLLKNSDASLIYSEEGRQYCLRIGIPEGKIFVLKNTLDVDQLLAIRSEVNSEELIELRRELGLGANTFVCLFVGRFHKRKEVDFLIRAFDVVHSKFPNARLVLVGGGELEEEIHQLINISGLGEAVIETGPIYCARELAKYFMIADVVTLPGQIGLTVVHSFAYGKPVITRKSKSYSPELEYLKNGENGLILSDTSVKAYAETLIKLYENPDVIKRLGEGADKAAKGLSMQHMVNAFRKAITYCS